MAKKAARKKIVTQINEKPVEKAILPVQEIASNDFPVVMQEAVSYQMGNACQKGKSFNYESTRSLLQYLVDCCQNMQEYSNSDYTQNTSKVLRESSHAAMDNYLEAKANIVSNNSENYKYQFDNIGLLRQSKGIDSITETRKNSFIANAEAVVDNLSVLNNAFNNFCKEVLYPLSSYSNQLVSEARKKTSGLGE